MRHLSSTRLVRAYEAQQLSVCSDHPPSPLPTGTRHGAAITLYRTVLHPLFDRIDASDMCFAGRRTGNH